MNIARLFLLTAFTMTLAACGGGGGGSVGGNGSGGGGSTSQPQQCSVLDRQQWTDDVFDQWYLFPDLLSTTVEPGDFSTVQGFIDALVEPARNQNRDRFFSFITSIEEENNLINNGSNAGFGIRLAFDTANRRAFILEAYEGAPGLAAGLDRGTELLAIGDGNSSPQLVSNLLGAGGAGAVIEALGPSDPGVTRTLRFRTVGGVETEASVTKTEFSIDPISDRYGVEIIDDGGKKVGYLNLRTFIVADAGPQLEQAFETFRAQGVTELIIDFRYNGGGLVSVADLMGDLLGRDYVGQRFSATEFRPSQNQEDSTRDFRANPAAISPTRIAFIGRTGTASASELVINSMIPYFGDQMALIGQNTFGKPVGQSAFDRSECDDRVRAVTFKTVNADGEGEYFNGLADVVPQTCRANDDIFTELGDPTEASVAAALSWLRGESCTSISGKLEGIAQEEPALRALQPERPNAAQYRMPGLF